MFLTTLMRGVGLLPYAIAGVEAIFGEGNGKTKQEKALELFGLSIGLTEAISQKNIVDQKAFEEALREMNDAIVKALNASVWANKSLSR